MNGVIRRRGFPTSKGIETIDIDRPDHWRIDFATTADNQTVVFGHNGWYALSNPETKAIILDGKTISRTSGSSINVPKAGNHTVYIKISQPYTISNYSFGITSPSLSPSYVRVPTNWTSAIRYDNGGNIPIVDLLTLKPNIYKTADYLHLTIDTLRVSDKIDIANIPSSWRDIANKIVQVHYNYI
jgi:hypothetical protein